MREILTRIFLAIALLCGGLAPCVAQTAEVFVKGDALQCWLDVKDIVHRRGSRVTDDDQRWTVQAGHFSTMSGDLVLQVHVSPDEDKQGDKGCRIYVSVSGGANLSTAGQRINSMTDNYRFAHLIAAEVEGMKKDHAEPAAGPNDHVPVISAADAAIPEAARIEFEKGKQLLEQNHDASGSEEHFRKAIKTYDKFSQAYTMLGLAYLQEQKLADSKAAFERAIQRDPQSGAAYVGLGGCLNLMKDYPGAEKALAKGLEIIPESPDGNYELAKTYWAMHRWQEAQPHAEKAEKLQPNVPGVHVLMGNILLQKQDAAGALKEFNEYLRLDPHGAMSDAVRAMVAKLEKNAAAHN